MPRIETLLAHAGCDPDPATGAAVSPIHLATTFERAVDGSYPLGYFYSRVDNPNRSQFEALLTELEGGAACMAFASGMAASSAVLQALQPGDHIILADDAYYGVRRVLGSVFNGWGLVYSQVDLTDPAALDAAFRPTTRLVWAETPSNPMHKITDLAAVAERSRQSNARLIVDGTWATPLLQRPLELGADLVLHSVTKYLAGHSDVLGGAIVCKQDDDFTGRIRMIQREMGPVMDPFSAWLTMRGMRSLGARLRVQCENARAIANMLVNHPRVKRVYYSGLPDHPRHDIAKRQMRDFGGMVSFEVDGTADDAMAVAARVKVFTRATSLGGTESLIEHRASIEAKPTRTPDTLLRLSLGLEHTQDLLEDLSQALDY